MATVVTVTAPGASSTVVPAGATAAKVQCWAAGGGGYGGGGSGGAYSETAALPVTAGATLYYSNGAGNTASGATGTGGGDTWARITTNSAPTTTAQGALAKGGRSPSDADFSGLPGGAAASGVGDTKYSGGAGANNDGTNGGGGGGGAGSGGNGGAGGQPTGGTGGTPDGGAGSAGQAAPAASNGNAPGGGGGGSMGAADGNGANGKIVITFNDAAAVLPSKIHVKHGATWKEPSKIYVKTPSSPRLDLDFTASDVLDPRITFSRASLGTYFDSAGVLKYAAHNFFLQSQNFATSWTASNGATVTADATTAPDGTTTADRLNHVTAGTVNGGRVTQSHSASAIFIVSVYAKAGSKSWLAIGASTGSSGPALCHFNLATGVVGSVGSQWAASGIESVGSGWYRCWARSTASTIASMALYGAEADATISMTSPGDIYLWGAQAESVTTATTPSTYLPTTTAAVHAPRFDYDPVTHAAKGLLIENARISLQWTSQDFTSGNWTKANIAATADQLTAPDGTNTADLMTVGGATTNSSINQGSSIPSDYLVQSVFAKKGTSDWIYLSIYPVSVADEPKAWFNLATGTVGTVEALLSGASIQPVGNGWYRCTISRAETGSNERCLYGISDGDNTKSVTVGRTVYLWGAQSENVSGLVRTFPSSYIPNGGSSNVTRAADVVTMTGSNFSSWYTQPQGTFVAEFDTTSVTGTGIIMQADVGAITDYISLFGSNADPKAKITRTSVVQADLDLGTLTVDATHKIGVSYAANDVAGCFDGGTVGTDTSATMPTPTMLRIGSDVGGTGNLLGHIRRIRFWNYAQSDVDLQALTAGGAISGSDWVEPLGGYIKAAGAWRQFYPSATGTGSTLDLDFTTMSTLDPRITFSRASLGTYYDSDGLLKYAAHNLAWPSVGFSGWAVVAGATITANDTTAPDATTTGARLNHVTAGTVTGGAINSASIAGALSLTILSVYAKVGTKNWLVLANSTSATSAQHCYFNLASGVVGLRGSTFVSSGIQNVGNGWYRCWGLCAIAGPSLVLRVGEVADSVTCTSPGNIYLWGAMVENVTTATTPSTYLPTTSAIAGGPRFDYDPVTHVAKGLLVEEARTNLAQGSQDFSNVGWIKTGTTVTADSTTAPDGTTTADLITASASPATVKFGAVQGGSYVTSFFVKRGTSDWVYLGGQNVLLPNAWFNINTGSVGTVQAGIDASGIQNIGNGWYRCWIVDTGDTGAEWATVGICDADNSTTVTVGRTIYLWGAQSESGAFPTSYTPTAVAATTARAADVAVMTGSNFSSWYNATGTFTVEFDTFVIASGQTTIMMADNGASTTEYVRFYKPSGTTTLRVSFVAAGASAADLNRGTITVGPVHKWAASWATNDFAASFNASAVAVDTTGAVPAPNQLRIGTDNLSQYINGHIRRIRFFNTAKSDAELQALTT